MIRLRGGNGRGGGIGGRGSRGMPNTQSRDIIPNRGDLLALIRPPLMVDSIGRDSRTIYPLQYIQGPVDMTHVDLTATCTGTENGDSTLDFSVAGTLTIGATTLWSFTITFDDETTSTYEFGTALSATTGVVFDTSGYGRHLLFTVADTDVTCATDLETGSDWLNQMGFTVANGSQYLSKISFGKIPYGVLIPTLSDRSGNCAWSVPDPKMYMQYPRLMSMSITDKSYFDEEYTPTYVYMDVVILGFTNGWNSGASVADEVSRIKLFNPDLLIGQYTVLGRSYYDDRTVSVDKYDKLNTEDWWLYDYQGNHILGNGDTDTWAINITDWVTADENGDRWPQWLAQREYDLAFGNADIDIWYFDNWFDTPRNALADWKITGIADQNNTDSAIVEACIDGYLSFLSSASLLSPSAIKIGNTDSGYGIQQYEQIMGGAFLESLMGRSWSVYENDGWSAMMTLYELAIANSKSPKIVGFNTKGTATNYQFMRLGLTSCLLLDGFYIYTDIVVSYGPSPIFDEYSVNLGDAIDQALPGPWEDGVHMREFDNGLVVVNSSGSPQDVTIPDGFRRISGIQDPVVNNGSTILGSTTIQANDGIILVRI